MQQPSQLSCLPEQYLQETRIYEWSLSCVDVFSDIDLFQQSDKDGFTTHLLWQNNTHDL